MPTLDTLHTLFAIATSVAMFIAMWVKVSKDNAVNRKSLDDHDKAIIALQVGKTDISVTAKLIAAVEKIESDLVQHHTDFNAHRTVDSEQRMRDLIQTVNELAKENRADHQVIMNKLGRVERIERVKSQPEENE